MSEDERFAKYFKMLKMGVPLQAVKNKMKGEGFDDSVLDNPDAPAGESVASSSSSRRVEEEDSSGGDESDSWE